MSEPPLVAHGRKPSGSPPEGAHCPGSSALPEGVSGLQDVVDFERLVDLAEPFGAVGCAAPAALVERQLQLAQQACDLLTRRHMAHAWAGAKRCLVEIVERGKPAGKEFRGKPRARQSHQWSGSRAGTTAR